jgi:uncharacterized protein (TIGR03089 family)
VADSVAAALQRRIASDPSRPFVTVLAPEGRVELSAASFGNWVTKTAGLLTYDLGLEPAAVVDIELPLGWQLLAWLHATWRAGLVVGDQAPELVVRDELATQPPAAPELVWVSRHPLGLPIKPEVQTGLDWSLAARVMPDRFGAPLPAPTGPAVALPELTLSQTELLDFARELVATWSIAPGGRPLVRTVGATWPLLLGAATVPLVADAALIVWVGDTQPDAAVLTAEGVTSVVN